MLLLPTPIPNRSSAPSRRNGRPSTEMCTTFQVTRSFKTRTPRLTWEEDRRHVKGQVVQHIMRLFLRNYFSGSPVTSAKLSASPNPVPDGIEPGKTTIRWFCHGAPDAAVYVSRNGAEEVLFAKDPHGSQELSGIGTDVTYEFSLYEAPDRKNRLAQISVTRPSFSAVPASKPDRVPSWR